jgi:hypothetical protein
VEAKQFWCAISVIIGAFTVVLKYGRSESSIRIIGMVLQLLGILTVAWGIHQTRALFGHPSILTLSRQWLSRFPRYGASRKLIIADMTLPLMIGRARGHSWAHAGPDATLEARVEVLEKNLNDANQRINQAFEEMDQQFIKHSGTLETEQQIRAREDQNILSKLETTETGGLYISAMGALWLFVGVTLSTVSTELAKWLN